MTKIDHQTPWSAVLKPTSSNPLPRDKNKRAIFLGYSRREAGIINVVIEGTRSPAAYSEGFWQVDEAYMSKREEIAELMGRIHESNEPSLIKNNIQADNELFELCKQVYEATGWTVTPWHVDNGYTSDYLLEKLPLIKGQTLNVVRLWENWWSGEYQLDLTHDEVPKLYSGGSDTPLKALLKLCLALHKEDLL